jgi:[ribosomal protein S18]-alanine N-acetyltransferase
MTVVPRAMGVPDLDAVAALEPVLFGPGGWSRAVVAEELEAPGRYYVVAESDQQVIGYAGLWFDGHDAQVMTLATAPARQGQGVGRALLRALLDRAVELGAEQVFLEVRVDNDPAIHLYRTEGFDVMGRRRRYYQPEDVDAWTMRRSLVAPSPG